MAYIGNIPAEKYISLSVQHFTVTATTSYTLDSGVTNENEIALFINNVRQEPGASYAYTATGTTLTLSVATAGTDSMYCLFLGKARETVTPALGSVTDAMLSGSISSAKITSLDATKLTGNVDIARLPAAVLNSNVATVDLAQLEMNQALLAFKIASSNQLAKFSMVDQVIDEYQDATGIDAGNSTNETAGGATTAKYYEGAVTGSPTTVVKSYTGANQTFVVPSGVTTINFIAWGAAGGGGFASGTGGGGGFIEGDVAVTAGETLNVEVGGGGVFANNGGGSTQGGGGGGTGIYRSSTVLAIAGAGGGGQSNGGGAGQGGAGGGTTGGSGGSYLSAPQATGGTQSAGGTQASGGGSGSLNQGGNAPDAVATNGTGGYNGGGKGDGDNTSWTAGGGGGGYYGGASGGTAGGYGSGGGGSSLTAGTNTQASTGTVANAGHANYQAGTGNGVAGATGQNGHAVIKYTAVVTSNLTLQSVATTAESAPTTADLVVLIEDGAGTATVNTDIKGFVSRDGSAFSTAVTFVDEGDWGTNKRILVARNIDISGITTGTAMKYKLTTHNQSASSKETRIHATSLAWA